MESDGGMPKETESIKTSTGPIISKPLKILRGKSPAVLSVVVGEYNAVTVAEETEVADAVEIWTVAPPTVTSASAPPDLIVVEVISNNFMRLEDSTEDSTVPSDTEVTGSCDDVLKPVVVVALSGSVLGSVAWLKADLEWFPISVDI